MHLTLLKADGHFVAWIDDASVRTGKTIDNLFGQLGKALEEGVRGNESITGSWETERGGRSYQAPSPEEIVRARSLLACFKGSLVDRVPSATEALK